MITGFLSFIACIYNSDCGTCKNFGNKETEKVIKSLQIENTVINFTKKHSVIDTTIENELNVLEALTIVAKFEVWTD